MEMNIEMLKEMSSADQDKDKDKDKSKKKKAASSSSASTAKKATAKKKWKVPGYGDFDSRRVLFAEFIVYYY